MPDARRRRPGSTGRWLDGLLAAAVALVAAAELTLATPRGTAFTLGLAAVQALAVGAVALRRRWPLALAPALSIACFVPGVLIGSRWWNAPSDALLLAIIILAYSVAAAADVLPAALGLVALCVGSSGGDLSDPIVLVVFTVPAWVAGRAMRARARLTVQLADRARELERERAAYVHEAVRYERARIARDLHDIIAHNLSMIVVQAGAGRRALGSDPAIVTRALRHIEGGAQRAELEIAQFVDLLADDTTEARRGGLRALDELVRRATASGLSLSYIPSGEPDDVSPELADAAFHVAQEGLTNALKHAPGAPIRIAVRATGGRISLLIENGPAGPSRSGLEEAGGRHGIAGLRDRVAALGGDVRAGPAPDGGWRLTAEVPSPPGAF